MIFNEDERLILLYIKECYPILGRYEENKENHIILEDWSYDEKFKDKNIKFLTVQGYEVDLSYEEYDFHQNVSVCNLKDFIELGDANDEVIIINEYYVETVCSDDFLGDYKEYPNVYYFSYNEVMNIGVKELLNEFLDEYSHKPIKDEDYIFTRCFSY